MPVTRASGSTRFAALAAVLVVLAAVGYLGWRAFSAPPPKPAPEPAPPQAPIKQTDRNWFDPVVGQRVGLFNKVETEAPTPEELAALGGLGYVQGSEAATGIEELQGVIVHDAESAQAGYNLYVSAHAPEAHLMTMDGEIVHSWKTDFATACKSQGAPKHHGQKWLRRARLLPDGSLLALFDYAGLVKLDRDSNVLWSRCKNYHHDIAVDDGGRIYTLGAAPLTVKRDGKDVYLMTDVVVVFDADGGKLREISVHEAFSAPEFADLLARAKHPDVFHSNSIKLLDSNPALDPKLFPPGGVVLSMRNVDAVAVVDIQGRKGTWSLLGDWRAQHESVPTGAGTILLFDNKGRDGRSRVLEVDPGTEEVVWSYDGDSDGGLYSPICGSNQRLANGNTLIVESTAGRALEVTPDKRIVWDFRTPHRVSLEGEELVAMLGDLVRVDAALVEGWLDVGESPR